MSVFTYTPLASSEEIVIGPITHSSSSSFSVSAGNARHSSASQTKVRKLGITTHRVIHEEGGGPTDVQIIDNSNVERVFVKERKQGYRLIRVEPTRGKGMTLNIDGLNKWQFARLFEIFPNAEIGEKRGFFGRFHKLDRPATPPARRSAKKPKASSSAAKLSARKSIISDPDVHSIDDLRQYFPLADGFNYAESADGEYIVKRLSDGAEFGILLEAGLLTFDVPTPEDKRRKRTVEVFKKG